MQHGSYFLELKQYYNKMIIFNYQIEEITYELFDKQIKTNKWVDLTVWLKVHEKLEKIFNESTGHDDLLKNFLKTEIDLANFGVNILIEKTDLKSEFTDIICLDTDHLYPYILQIYINHISSKTELETIKTIHEDEEIPKRKHKKLKKDKVHNIQKDSNEYNPLNPRPRLNKNEEIVYIASKPVDIIPYKATKKDKNDAHKVRISADDVAFENDPYSPKPIDLNTEPILRSPELFSESLPEEIPMYKATPILIKSQNSPTILTIKDEEEIIPKSKHSQKKAAHKNYDIEIVDETTSVKDRILRETRSKRRLENDFDNNNSNKNFKATSIKEPKFSVKKELFGSDDSDTEIVNDYVINPVLKTGLLTKTDDNFMKPSSKIDKKIKRIDKSTKSSIAECSDESIASRKVKQKHKPSNQGDLDGWLSKKNIVSDKPSSKIKSVSKTNGSDLSDDQDKNSNIKEFRVKVQKPSTPYPVALPSYERQINREKHEREMQALHKFNKHMKERLKKTICVEFKSLNHLTAVNILNTFHSYKKLLDDHFYKYKAQKYHVVEVIQGFNHLILRSVINDNLQYEMLQFLKNRYEKAEEDCLCYTDLFMNLMLPEWILGIFMKEHNLSRANAIQQLKDQEDSKVCSQMDNSFMSLSQISNS